MRKVVIGRGRECNVVLADTTDVVSRRQAVIVFTFWGKMTLYDTSSNGTFVNGQRLAKQEAKVVTRKDAINFGRVWDLDWSAVKDPYRNTKVALACTIVALLVAVSALLIFQTSRKVNGPEQETIPTDTLTTDSVRPSQDTIVPAPAAEPAQTKNRTVNETKQQQKSKPRKRQSYSEDYADSVAVFEDDSPSKTNEAPLIY